MHRLKIENGQEQASDVPVTVVDRDDDYFYISMDGGSGLQEGDQLINDARDQKISGRRNGRNHRRVQRDSRRRGISKSQNHRGKR